MPGPSISRRQFISGIRQENPARILPPGASLESVARACTGCGQCAERCPTRIIRIAGGRPFVDFTQGECTFCGACSEACPEPVFEPRPPIRFDHVATIGSGCLARGGVSCQSCRDACAHDAIRFRPRIGGPFLPELLAEECTGCGACLSICPGAAISLAPRSTEVADG